MEAQINIALMHASRLIDENLVWMMLKKIALSAVAHLRLISIPKQKHVREHVVNSCAAKRISNRVFDIEVEGIPEYFAGNILVHNCRYALDAYITTKGMPRFSKTDLSRI